MARKISQLKALFVNNVKTLVEQYVNVGNNNFSSFKEFKSHMEVELNVTSRTIDNYFDIKKEIMPDLEKLDWICDELGVELSELFQDKTVTYDSSKEQKKFIKNILYFITTNYISSMRCDEHKVDFTINVGILSHVISIVFSMNKLNIDFKVIYNTVEKMLKDISDNSFYYQGIFYDDEHVKRCFKTYVEDKSYKKKCMFLSDFEEIDGDNETYYTYLLEKEKVWDNMNRIQKIDFWNKFCSDERP